MNVSRIELFRGGALLIAEVMVISVVPILAPPLSVAIIMLSVIGLTFLPDLLFAKNRFLAFQQPSSDCKPSPADVKHSRILFSLYFLTSASFITTGAMMIVMPQLYLVPAAVSLVLVVVLGLAFLYRPNGKVGGRIEQGGVSRELMQRFCHAQAKVNQYDPQMRNDDHCSKGLRVER